MGRLVVIGMLDVPYRGFGDGVSQGVGNLTISSLPYGDVFYLVGIDYV